MKFEFAEVESWVDENLTNEFIRTHAKESFPQMHKLVEKLTTKRLNALDKPPSADNLAELLEEEFFREGTCTAIRNGAKTGLVKGSYKIGSLNDFKEKVFDEFAYSIKSEVENSLATAQKKDRFGAASYRRS